MAHAGAAFDADGDGVEEAVYYNGYRGGVDLVGPKASTKRNLACAPSFLSRATNASRYPWVWGTLNAGEHHRRQNTSTATPGTVFQFLGSALGAQRETDEQSL